MREISLDLDQHDGLFITISLTHEHDAAIVASKSWINLQTETRSRCGGTWRTDVWSTLEIKSKSVLSSREVIPQNVRSATVIWSHSGGHVGACSR